MQAAPVPPTLSARATTFGAASFGEDYARRSSSRRTVWNGFQWALAGNFAYALAQFGILVVLAKVATPQQVGQYALALAVTGPIVMFSNLQLRAVLASDAGRTHDFQDYWQLRLLTTPIACLVVAAIAIFGNYGVGTALVIVVAGGAKSLETFSDLCYGASQRNDRLDLVGKSLIIKGLLSVVAMGALTWITQNVAVGVAGLGAVWLVLLLGYDLPNVRRVDKDGIPPLNTFHSIDWSRQRQLVAVGLPLGFSIALLSLSVAIPNLLVERYLGVREVGIFAAFSSLAWTGIPLINALGQTAMPKLGELCFAGNRCRLRAIVASLAMLGAALGIAGVIGAHFAGARVVEIVYGPEYARQADVLAWLLAAAAALFATRFVGDALTAMRCTRIQVTSQAIVALVVAVGGMLVLPHQGLSGMAKVVTAAFVLRAAILVGCFYLESAKIQPRSKSYCR